MATSRRRHRVLSYLGLAGGPHGPAALPRKQARLVFIVSGVGLPLVVVGGILLLTGHSPLWFAFSAPGAVLVVTSTQLERRARRKVGRS